MHKKLLAIAVAGALAPAAAMAQSTVEIYGRANLGIDLWEAEGATLAAGNLESRTRIFDVGSRVGFRVNESLGGGMRAFAVIESGVNIDSGSGNGQSGGPNASTGVWASRDSYLGLGGGWGDVRLGRQSLWYGNGIIAQAGANYINHSADQNYTNHGVVAAPVIRQPNSISYNSPTIGGFNATLAWATNSEGSTFTGVAPQEEDTIWAATARYTGGPIRAQLDWARRNNVGFVDGRDNTAWKIGVGYAYAPGSQISFITGSLQNENIAGAVGGVLGVAGDDPEVDMHVINWEHMLGQWQLIAQYLFTGDVDGITANPGGTKTKAWTLAAKYFLSKRTGVYVSYNQIKNEANAWMDFSSAGYSSANTSLGGANRGADPRIIALGIMHNF